MELSLASLTSLKSNKNINTKKEKNHDKRKNFI